MRLSAPLATIQPTLSSPTSSVDVGHFACSPNGDFLAFGGEFIYSRYLDVLNVHKLFLSRSIDV